MDTLQELEKGFAIVNRTARVGLDLADASLEKKARWFYIWCGDVAGELGEVAKLSHLLSSDPKLKVEVGDVLWGICALSMLCKISPAELLGFEISVSEQVHTKYEVLLQGLELLDYGKKICRDGLEVRQIDRDLVLRQLALIFDYLDAHYRIDLAFESVNQKLLLRYPNGYTPQASVDRKDLEVRS